MKHILSSWKSLVVAGAILVVVAVASAAPAESNANPKPKPYTLKTCIVSGEKLDGDMGKPHVFTYEKREIKLCCKGCLKDFNKEPAKYLKKLDEAEKAKAKTDAATGKAPEGHGAHQH